MTSWLISDFGLNSQIRLRSDSGPVLPISALIPVHVSNLDGASPKSTKTAFMISLISDGGSFIDRIFQGFNRKITLDLDQGSAD